jgi:lipopolysaccharide transport system permease protein
MPKLAFPFVSVIVNTAKFVLVLALLLILLPLAGRYPSSAYVWLPALFVVQLALVTAGVVIAAALVPLVPSLQIIINTGLRVGMFLSGVFFSAVQVPAHLQPWLRLNPMFVLIESWRAVLLHGRAPGVGELAAVLLVSLASLWLGERIIRRHEFEYPRLSP